MGLNIKCILPIAIYVLLINFAFSQKYYLVSPNGQNAYIPGTLQMFPSTHVFDSLSAAHNSIYTEYGENVDGDITIYVKEGLYFQSTIMWKITSAIYTIKLINYPQEEVVFDGTKPTRPKEIYSSFITLESKYERTNLWIEGFTIQNYMNGISLGKTDRPDPNGPVVPAIQSSHNTIKNNVFRFLGNKYIDNYSLGQEGNSVIGVVNSTNNVITSNIFSRQKTTKEIKREQCTQFT